MALTPSTMIPLGTPMPAFALPNADGKAVNSNALGGKPLVVMFICNHCPFVKHIADGLAAFGKDTVAKGVNVVAINSNDFASYPADSPAKMREEIALRGYEFEYLVDEDQSVAKAFDAACTPDFFLFDRDGKLAYRGQFDDSRPGNDAPVNGKDLHAAVNAVLAGEKPADDQVASIGCNIKWK
ncbi:thioredoxin family protein [Microbulbifer agarilyticus]|uniref:thioredoxin family protein n=1 Tax=Microbulbifer agarilyticus TaxID=260552 RepID=UPI001CD7CFB1|nr:thioredoxin family protein [Microbulbifer agarilyticus]MCA0892724.1 thioredoxin family protein [Microbulbifer agarilyticus]